MDNTQASIDDYTRIRDMIKSEAVKQYQQQLREKKINKTTHYQLATVSYQEIEELLIAERIQLEEFSK